jgi:mono/diheme cytochrome c family protein
VLVKDRKMKHLIKGGIVILFLTFITSCKNDETVDQGALDQAAFDAADAIRGGQFYDKFWNASGFDAPVDATVNMADITEFSNFYRCKQCHGWDLKANTGWYIDRAPKQDRPNVSAAALWEPIENDGIRELFDELKGGGAAIDPARTADGTNSSLGGDQMPDFSRIFTDEQVWDIVKFLKEGALNTDQLYDLATQGSYPTGSKAMTNLGKDGDAAAGDTFYANKCAGCHGATGLQIPLEGKSLGDFARGGPHETQHKIKNGHPGSIMNGLPDATLTDVKNVLKALADDAKFPSN